MDEAKTKLRWWQFSLRKFILLTTLITVLAVGGWRYREWGRTLSETSQAMSVERKQLELDMERALLLHEQAVSFNKKYWLPMRAYEWTSWPPETEQQKAGSAFRSGGLIPQGE